MSNEYTCAHEMGINELVMAYLSRAKRRGAIESRKEFERIGRVADSAEFYIFANHVGIRTHDEMLARQMAHRVYGYALNKLITPRNINGVWWVLFVPKPGDL